mgnify:FL=1
MGHVDREFSDPVVNLNGSSRERLVEGYCNVAAALRDAQAMMMEIAPHGRDYQTMADSVAALDAARRRHVARCAALDDMVAEYERLALVAS